MRYVGHIVAIATLAGSVAGCASPYYPRYGYSQAYSYPSGYNYYPASRYSYYSPPYAYSPATWSYYRNYRGIGHERPFP